VNVNKSKLLLSLLAGTVAIGLLLTACESDDDNGANVAPVMDSISGPDLVVAGGTAAFIAMGTDDDGDDLTYTYSSTAGSFTGGNWTAPTSDGRYTISCVANDGSDDSDPLTMEVVVATVPDYAHHWPFNGDGIELVSGEDVTLPSSASFGTGTVGQAALFDGEDLVATDAAFGTDTPSLAAADDFSFSFWYATEDSGGFWFGKTYDGIYLPDPATGDFEVGSAKGLMFGVGDDGFIYLNYDNSWIGSIGETTGYPPDGSWHLAVVTHVSNTAATDPDVYAVYCDGDTVATGLLGDTNADTDAVITMGGALEDVAYGEWPGAYQGYMDEVVYWDVVLTAAQVAALFDAH
jgi:hypothetical protein